MKYIYILLLIFLNTNFLLNAQELASPFITNYTPKEYNFDTQNWEIIKDKRGVIFIANTKGILEYDGQKWRKILIESNLPVRALCMDRRGTIFVGGVGGFGFLKPDSTGMLNYKSISNSLDSNVLKVLPNVWRVRIIDDIVYFNTFEAIYMYSIYSKKIKVWRPEARFFLGFNLNNKFYIAESSKGLLVQENDSLILVKQGEKLKETVIFGMQNYDDKIIIALSDRLIIYNESADTTKGESCFENFETEADQIFKEAPIYSIIELPNEKYAIATTAKGVVIIDKKGKITDLINAQNNLINETVWSINYFDNALWLATNNGYAIAEISSPFRVWLSDNVLSGSIQSIMRFNKKLYLASTDGIFALDTNRNAENGQISSFKKISVRSNESWSFLKITNINENRLLCGTSRGLVEITESGIVNKIAVPTAFSLLSYSQKDNIYFAGCTKSLLIMQLLHSTNSWEIKEILGFDGEIRSMAFEGNTLWLSTFYNGVFKMEFNNILSSTEISKTDYKISHLDTASGFKGIVDIMVYNIDNKIIFTSPNGIYDYNSETKKVKPTDKFGDYFKTNGLYKFIKNNKGQIWVDAKGLLYKKADKYLLDSTFIKRNPFISLNAIYFDEASNHWFAGSSDGLLRYSKDNEINYSEKFNALLRKIKIKNDSVIFNGCYTIYNDSLEYQLISEVQTNTNKHRIQYKYNTINFEFSANFYISPKTTKFTYKLEGFDEQWSKPSQKTEKEYTNLPPGTFKFKIKAINIYDIESEIDTYEFTILPPWYKTWWAYIIYIIFGIISFIYLIKIFTKRLKDRNLRLERLVQKRTAELQEQSLEILNKNEKLYQQKEEIKAQAEELEATNHELIQLSIVASKTDNAVLIFDKNYNLEWTNNAFLKLYGYSFKEFTHEKINLIKNSTVPGIENILNECISKQKSVSYKARNKNITEEIIWVQTSLTPIFELDKLKKIIAIESDITDLIKTNNKLKNAYLEISIQNKQIKSSIQYAQTIQRAILPIRKDMDKYFNNFILYRPKDVVSGDFYWFSVAKLYKDKEEFIRFIAVVDCTGHGVPGAFMSMIGNSLLNEIIKQRKIYDPKTILFKLNYEIRKSLKQDITENHDGMDICLCRIQEEQNKTSNLTHYKIIFSGAKRPLYYYKSQKNELDKLKGDRINIGGIIQKHKKVPFTNQEIILQQNDLIYLTTDGYADQNDKNRKRFGTKKFENVLSKIASKDLPEQEQIIATELEQWQGKEEQRDDITIVGVKLRNFKTSKFQNFETSKL